jgi:hypothetical protein
MKMDKRILIVVITICLLSLVAATEAVEENEVLAKIIVNAGKYERVDTPVSVTLAGLAGTIKGEDIYLREVQDDSTNSVPSQIEMGEFPQLWWILSGITEPGEQRVYELVKGSYSNEPAVEIDKTDKYIDLVKNGNKVLRYNNAIVPAPEGQSSVYNRSGFIHPLWSPSGAVLTDIHPPDHIHHLGIWMQWTKTKFEDKEVDFWNLGKGEGTVRFVKFISTTSGPVYGGFKAEHEHVALKTSEGEKVVLNEVWDVRVYNVGGTEKGYWLIDFKSTERCVADKPLYQGQYRYGGLGFRGARQWKGENASYLTSEGKTRKDGHATRARWCDTAGAIEGKWAGITHFSHPQNFQHPEPMRIWPEFEKNIFFNFVPSQAGEWEMEPGKDYVFRYRLYVHEGKISVDDAEHIWHDYAEPPEAKIEFVLQGLKVVL